MWWPLSVYMNCIDNGISWNHFSGVYILGNGVGFFGGLHHAGVSRPRFLSLAMAPWNMEGVSISHSISLDYTIT